MLRALRDFRRTSPRRILYIYISAAACIALSAPTAAANSKYAGLVVDANTGIVLYADRADQQRYPASLTKMMTLYLTFEGLDAGRFSEHSSVPISANAAAEPPSKLGLRAGSSITVQDAMHALVTKSANDVATALGEFLAGSEERFAQLATAKARSLGMMSTTFRNAHGLPDPRQVTTAKDMATLGLSLRQHFPHRYALFQTRSYKIGKRTLRSHNRLVGSVAGVDGIKTGYIRASGFNLVTSIERDGRSLVAVVLGGRSAASRDAHMRDLISRYLPRASKTVRGMTVARNQLRTVPSPLPPLGPLPGERVQAASTTSKPLEVATISAYVSDVQLDPMTTGSTGGWAVQIAATPRADMAQRMLQDARIDLGLSPSEARNEISEVQVNGTILYRARFVGFHDGRQAIDACRRLKSQGASCWVMSR